LLILQSVGVFIVKKATLYKQLKDKKVKCLACQHYCTIENQTVGFCSSRLNRGGQLYALNYGVLSSINVDPIEKKPLYHFHPGSEVLSIGSYGCNYRCKQCLNYSCSWGERAMDLLQELKQGKKMDTVAPEEVVRLAMERNIPGIAFTYNEPSIYPEYVYAVAKLAKEKGLYTVYVSNGSWTEEGLEKLAPVIDAANIDIKGFSQETYKQMGAFWGDVLKMTENGVERGIFTEITTLLIPGVNDAEAELNKLANWISEKIGPETPWHLSRFAPELAADQEFQQIKTTTVEQLRKAYKIGLEQGLKHIYIWAPGRRGVEGFSMGDTVCPECGEAVIERTAWEPENNGVVEKEDGLVCKFCGTKLNLIGRVKENDRY
jgi:pyruvate formate lyase activating enzyme